MTAIERRVEVNADQESYVIHHDGYVSRLGFDVLLDRLERVVAELVGRGVLPGSYLNDELAAVKATRGTIEAYDTFENLRERLRKTCEDDGDRAVYDLSPQLTGLEGWRVEVVDVDDSKPRRFIVGRSAGWAPCHLEICRRNSTGGYAARREYRSVRKVERVRR